MNKVQILGTMTKDCELRYTQGGTAIGNFGIAWNEKIKDQATGQYNDKAHFFDVTAWGKTAENINKFFKKGSRILLDGQLEFSQWEKDGQKRSKVGVKVREFHFIDRKSDNQAQAPRQPQSNYSAPQQPQGSQNQQAHSSTPIPEIKIDSDEIPF